MTALAVSTPTINEAFFDKLKATFRPSHITPTSEMADIMYEAGQQRVIEWIEQHRTVKTLTNLRRD